MAKRKVSSDTVENNREGRRAENLAGRIGAGQGRAGQGRAEQVRAEQSRAGQSRAGLIGYGTHSKVLFCSFFT